MNHRPRKRFGQNFLVDKQVIADIISAIRPTEQDNMVEIGPGLGALTHSLLTHLCQLHVIEIDRDIIARLEHEYPRSKLVIHAGDALQFDFTQLPAPLRVVGNLPYNISSPLLFHVATYRDRISDMHFMLQDEVVERMVASHSTPAYGRLSVMLQSRFYMEKLFEVPPQSFRPVPKVNSAIVRMIPLPPGKVSARDDEVFAEIVTAAFSQRRKTLRNTLKTYMTDAQLEQLGIAPQLRAENLEVEDFAKIANWIHKTRSI